MAKYVCEMCGCEDVSKENGGYVCSVCGYKSVPDINNGNDEAQTEAQRLKRERQEKLEQIKRETQKKKAKIVATICFAAFVALFLILFLTNTLIIPATKFNKAISLMEKGKYSEARTMLFELDGFGSSENKLAILNAIRTIESGEYDAAIKKVLAASEDINVKYNLNGGTSSKGDNFTYSTSSDYSSLLTPQKEGYRFVEWKLSGYSYSKENSLELVLDAVWSDGYFITYKLDGGTATNPTEYHKDGDAITLNNPTQKGYTFIGWTGTDLTDLTMNVTIPAGSYGDREYTANWEAHGRITYNLDGGKATNISEYTFLDDDFTLNNPTRKGYTFIGWTGTDLNGLTMTVTILTGSHGNREFTANWQPNKYTFTLNANGGTVSSSSIFADYNASYTLPTPTRDYYTFEGWYDGTKKYADGTWREANNVTLTAKWTPISYTITYNLSGGTNSSQNAKNFTVESSRISLKDPTRKGYKFLGWYKDSSYSNKVTEIVSGSHENISLYAKWEIINYTITYSLNGGTVSGTIETTFTVNDLPLQLPTPSKTGYVFLNWSVDSVDGTSIETITSLNNISIVANYMMEGLSLELSRDKTYYTVNYSGAATHVEISSYYQGKPVKKIAGFRESLTLESITIPNTIEVIEEYCFYGCVSLASIVIPDSVTVIDSFAFYGCSNLKSLTIGKGLKSIGSYAFEDTEITDLYLNDLASWLNVEFDFLSSHPFDGYSSSKRNLYITGKLTTNLIIPDGVTSIGSDAFNNCTGITSVSIPDSVASIGSGAFSGCDNLTSVSIGSGVTSIGMYAFYDCENLTNVNIPNSVTNIGSRAFYFCENLKKVIIPASVKTIGDYAFSGYYGLEVYCRISTKPIGWNSSWIESSYGGKVVWGYTGD